MLAMILTIIVLFIILVLSFTIFSKPHTKESRPKKSNKKTNKLDIEEKGKVAEKNLIEELLDLGFHKEDIFENLYIEKDNGKFSQVDTVLLTKVGVIVFEVKNYSGWIYGDAAELNWQQILNNGEITNQFYNPVKQNYTHIVELKKNVAEMSKLPFYSVIVFYGDSELKKIHCGYNNTFIIKPSEIFEVINHFIKHNKILDYDNRDKEKIVSTLKQYASNGDNKNIVKRHSRNISDMLDNVEHKSTNKK